MSTAREIRPTLTTESCVLCGKGASPGASWAERWQSPRSKKVSRANGRPSQDRCVSGLTDHAPGSRALLGFGT